MNRHVKIPFFFLIPAFLLLAAFVLYPIVNTVYLSFFDQSGNFVKLENYKKVFGTKLYPLINVKNVALGKFPMGALIHNILCMTIHLPLCVFFGLLLAVLLRDVKGGSIMKSVIFLGMVIPLIVGGVLVRFTLDRDAGVLNGILRAIGLGGLVADWTVYPNTALIAVILGSVWIWTGFSMIVYSAGLEGIPIDLYEAAKIDGASRWKTFWRITVPMLKPATIIVVTMTLLWELKIFDIVYIVTNAGPGGASDVMAFRMYIQAFESPPNYGTASAIATLLTIITLGFAAYMVNRMTKS
jgi:multiple sugar transport system permease protein